MKKWTLLIVLVMLLALSIVLCACDTGVGGNDKPQNNDQNQTNNDDGDQENKTPTIEEEHASLVAQLSNAGDNETLKTQCEIHSAQHEGCDILQSADYAKLAANIEKGKQASEHARLSSRLFSINAESSKSELTSLQSNCIAHSQTHDGCDLLETNLYANLLQRLADLEMQEKHNSLLTKLQQSDFEDSYSDLFATYCECIAHTTEHTGCSLMMSSTFSNFLKYMLYGRWEDAESGAFISYIYEYSDYNNTEGNTWYSTNLKSSRISGSSYYYYTDTDGATLIIGYQDKLTEEKTDNFFITFQENSLSVYNANNEKTYTLNAMADYEKVVKGNARKAYIYIAKNIFDFKYPASVKVTACAVEDDVVYATIQATNGFGGTNNTQYKIYVSSGQYIMTEYSFSKSTNVDLTELNQKLQSYVASGG